VHCSAPVEKKITNQNTLFVCVITVLGGWWTVMNSTYWFYCPILGS